MLEVERCCCGNAECESQNTDTARAVTLAKEKGEVPEQKWRLISEFDFFCQQIDPILDQVQKSLAKRAEAQREAEAEAAAKAKAEADERARERKQQQSQQPAKPSLSLQPAVDDSLNLDDLGLDEPHHESAEACVCRECSRSDCPHPSSVLALLKRTWIA